MAPWPTSLKHTATCASTRGRRECGTRRAKWPGILASPGCRTCPVGLALVPCRMQSKGLLFLGSPLALLLLSGLSLRCREPHDQLLQRLPELDDLQASWLSLLFCCFSRCNYLLRMLLPSVTAEYAGARDSAVLSTFADFLGVDGLPDRARRIAQLPLSLGGLGLMSAAQTSVSAYRAFCAGCLPVLGQHLPPAAQAFRDRVAVWTPPSWRELCDGVPAPTLQEDGPSTLARGWQGAAASAVARRQCEQLLSTLDPSSEASLRSQQGPFASRFLTTVPTCPALSYPFHLFRVLLAPAPSAATFPALLPVSSPFGLPRRPPRSLCSGRCPPELRVPSRAGRRACAARPGRG